MLKKFVVGAVAAGAMSLPFAGVALADHGNNGHGNGNGNTNTNTNSNGGIPGSIQSQYGLSAPVPPGQWLGQLRQNTTLPLPQWLRENGYQSPGDIISGIAQGNSLTDQIPAPVTSQSSGDTTSGSGITQGALPQADQILAPVTSQNPFDINGIIQGILPQADQILAPITSPTG